MDGRTVALVGVGGLTGATNRCAVSIALSTTFPWGTLAVNAAGAFLLGLFVYGTPALRRVSEPTRPAVATGFLSSFTTYSAFVVETVTLPPALAAGNVAANYALGFVAVAVARGVVLWRS